MSSPAPILSIVIVAYKSRDELPACLASLPADLRGRPVETCVVNNSPGDGVAAWVAGAFPVVKFIETGENLGFGRANNLGYRATTGECVLFLNPDTIGNRAALEHCVARALAEPDLGLIASGDFAATGKMMRADTSSLQAYFTPAGIVQALFSGLISVLTTLIVFGPAPSVYRELKARGSGGSSESGGNGGW